MKKSAYLKLVIVLLFILFSTGKSTFALEEQELKASPVTENQSSVTLKGKVNEDVNQRKPLSGIGVVGIRFIHQQGFPSYIQQVYPNSPAEKSGLRPKDLIFAIDGIRTDQLNSDAVYQMLSGHPGTKVRVFITRGQSMFNLEIVREDLANLSTEIQNRYLSGPIAVPFNIEDVIPYQ